MVVVKQGTSATVGPVPSGTAVSARPSPILRLGLRVTAAVRRYVAGLDRVGLVVAVMFFLQSLAPSLLPRHWAVQALVSGIGLAGGYGIGVALSWLLRVLRTPSLPERARVWTWRVLGMLSASAVLTGLWMSSGWQAEIRETVGMDDGHRHHYIRVLVLAMAIAMALHTVARGVRRLWHVLDRLIRRVLPPPLSGAIAALIVAALVLGVATDVVTAGARRAVEASFAAADELTDPDVARPRSPNRSGSAASLVAWDTLGRDGRTFVAGGPSADDITALTGRPAIEPVRVYVGRESASSPREQADLVVAELRRTNADRRAVIAVAGTTGRGWIPPSSTVPLEYVNGGDTAIAAMQYSYFPSWISFLADRTESEESGSAIVDAVHAYWSSLPAATRPRFVVFGTSLGAFATMSAFDGLDDLETRVDAALFIGPPHSTPLWREIVARRRPGSPQVLPAVGDGRDVRFFGRSDDLMDPDGTLSRTRIAIAQHGSDPIVWWSPELIWKRPDWLREPRAPDVSPRMGWFPWVTFWQLTTDQMASMDTPPGYGHDYGPELITAWLALLRPSDWTSGDTEKLTRLMSTG